MQRHPQWSWGNFPILLHPPKLYEASNCTLCGLNPNFVRYKILNALKITKIQERSQRKQKLQHFIYLPTNRSCKRCIADIAIQTPWITIHHCLLALSWPKTILKQNTSGRENNKQKPKNTCWLKYEVTLL